jgi:hypothetical protein
MLANATKIETFLDANWEPIEKKELTESLQNIRDTVCNHALRKKRRLARVEAIVDTVGGATIFTTNLNVAGAFPMAGLSTWYGGNLVSIGIKKFKETMRPFD